MAPSASHRFGSPAAAEQRVVLAGGVPDVCDLQREDCLRARVGQRFQVRSGHLEAHLRPMWLRGARRAGVGQQETRPGEARPAPAPPAIAPPCSPCPKRRLPCQYAARDLHVAFRLRRVPGKTVRVRRLSAAVRPTQRTTGRPAMTGILILATAAEPEAAAQQPARSAVEGRFAASAQVTAPIMSAFWQLGEFGTSTESRVLMSTTQERYPDMEAPHGEGSPVDNPRSLRWSWLRRRPLRYTTRS